MNDYNVNHYPQKPQTCEEYVLNELEKEKKENELLNKEYNEVNGKFILQEKENFDLRLAKDILDRVLEHFDFDTYKNEYVITLSDKTLINDIKEYKNGK